MVLFGPLSSVFDFVTYGLMLSVFRADQALFHTAWFVESLSTQILVIFIIRTARSLYRERPHPALVASTLFAFALAVALPYSPLAHWLGFTPVPATVWARSRRYAVTYLVAVHWLKRWFFARYQLG